jgi:DNA (cytosine-5)-methyltransferase 1
VAQRRRRVFVVVDFGGAVDPAAVLLEPDRLRWDSPPRREAGQGVAGTVAARTRGGGGLGTDLDCDGGLIAAEVASTLNAAFGSKLGLEDQHINAGAPLFVTHALRGEGFDASEDGTGRGMPLVPVSVFDPNQITSKTNRSVPTPELCHSLRGAPNAPIAFTSNDFGSDAAVDLSPTLRVGGHAGGPVPPAIAIQERAVSENPKAGPQGKGYQAELAYTLEARNKVQSVATDWAVRRLTPTECHRLQGFPDDHCDVPWRGKPGAPDGPQYKALGNSMAVPVMRWILDRVRISAAVASQPQSLFDGAAE